MSNNKHITQSQLKELLSYDRETGIFTWLVARSNRIKVGNEAGKTKGSHGYKSIALTIDGENKSYLIHRLAWFYVYGNFPKHQLDHIDHDRLNNKIDNLREATNKKNSRNSSMKNTNTSGFTGVHFAKREQKWLASITVNDKGIHLGYFKNKDDAIEARKKANKKYKFHDNHWK